MTSRFFESFRIRLDRYASLDKLEVFSLRAMFLEVLKRRSADEVDDYFQIGSRGSTPRILDVCTTWPKPWFFARVPQRGRRSPVRPLSVHRWTDRTATDSTMWMFSKDRLAVHLRAARYGG
jgi:hypothetical protein